ncbi:hypothetical protein CHARACLAT_002307 [Characodon lateralis]|uniref:Uncharacterized protein n=1 Tax=Characodon lateralis TaxID=208331 RepID=A0ABU7D3F4_9TELE|nr:hypothetical protein [Characodon lateralis]
MVPNKWSMNSVLHKSPPRSWLGLRLRLNDKPVQEEDWVVCQHPECPDRRRASKAERATRRGCYEAYHLSVLGK